MSMGQYWWNKFLERGAILFDYMIHNYDTMIDTDTLTIKHFNIIYGFYWLVDYINDIKNVYSKDIQQELIPWIQHEFESGELVKSKNWKPFRDSYDPTDSLFGYRTMFHFKHYWFQLCMDWGCSVTDHQSGKQNAICMHCIKGVYHSNFILALYGWKETGESELQPEAIFTIPEDHRIPESFWMHEDE